jgi:hypothetical protein
LRPDTSNRFLATDNLPACTPAAGSRSGFNLVALQNTRMTVDSTAGGTHCFRPPIR